MHLRCCYPLRWTFSPLAKLAHFGRFRLAVAPALPARSSLKSLARRNKLQIG